MSEQAPIAVPTPVVATETAPITSVKQTPTMEKLKVNGKEIEVSIDDLKNAYGLHKAAEGKFQDAAKMRKEAQDLKESLSKKDIDSLLKNGWTESELEEKAAEYLVKRAQRQSMTPQQLQQLEQQKEYESLKKEKLDKESAEKTKVQKEIENRKTKDIQDNFIKDITTENAKTWLDLEDPVILETIIKDIVTAENKYEYQMSVNEAVKRLEERLNNRGSIKKEYLKKLIKNAKIDIDDSDLDALLEKGAKGLRDRSVEVFRKSESPFAKHNKPQTQSTPAQSDEPKRDLKWYRDVKMGRVNPFDKK